MMENRLLKISIIISLGGLLILYIIMVNSNIPFVEAKDIDEKYFSKTIRSEMEFSSMKQYNDSTIIYPKNERLRLIIFSDEALTIDNGSIIGFSGKVDADEYGTFIILDDMEVRKKR